MESVVMIVNSIVGIQSNSSKGITGKNRRRTKKKCMWFLSLSCLFSVGMEKTMPVVPRKNTSNELQISVEKQISNEKEMRWSESQREREIWFTLRLHHFSSLSFTRLPFAISSDDSVPPLPPSPPPLTMFSCVRMSQVSVVAVVISVFLLLLFQLFLIFGFCCCCFFSRLLPPKKKFIYFLFNEKPHPIPC